MLWHISKPNIILDWCSTRRTLTLTNPASTNVTGKNFMVTQSKQYPCYHHFFEHEIFTVFTILLATTVHSYIGTRGDVARTMAAATI